MSIDRFIRRNWFALLLVGLHSLLVGIYAWIELDNAWNDMNPTMLVMMALHVVDYPIHALLSPLIDSTEQTGTYLATLLVVGGVFWFLVGTLVTYACRIARDMLVSSQTAANCASAKSSD